MNKVVCLVGMCGSGKSVVGEEFVKHGYKYIRFGQIVMDTIKERGLEVSEENERKIREGLRAEHGMAAFAILNLPKIETLLKEGNVIADGLYSWDEYKVLKEHFSDKLAVIAIIVPPELRYTRLEARTQVDEKMINRPMTREMAKKRDYAEIENSDKGGPIAMADYNIFNTGTFEEFLAEINRVIKELE
ncbi:MAG: AAA family ATPase [Candidatus Woesearchaeota archaeon]